MHRQLIQSLLHNFTGAQLPILQVQPSSVQNTILICTSTDRMCATIAWALQKDLLFNSKHFVVSNDGQLIVYKSDVDDLKRCCRNCRDGL